jgi:hypothetical protein
MTLTISDGEFGRAGKRGHDHYEGEKGEGDGFLLGELVGHRRNALGRQ